MRLMVAGASLLAKGAPLMLANTCWGCAASVAAALMTGVDFVHNWGIQLIQRRFSEIPGKKNRFRGPEVKVQGGG